MWLIDRLSEGLDVLESGSAASGRSRTMRGSLEWSYRLLDDRLAPLFGRLAVFGGGTSIQSSGKAAMARPRMSPPSWISHWSTSILSYWGGEPSRLPSSSISLVKLDVQWFDIDWVPSSPHARRNFASR